MISMTAINAGGMRWWDDHPTDQTPFNPENSHRIVNLLGLYADSEDDSDAELLEPPTDSP